MIVVKVELWPYGEEHRARELARMTIGNVGGNDAYGDYAVVVAAAPACTPPALSWRAVEASVHRHMRLCEPIWSLVAKSLAACGWRA